jgi:hypothetical protein
MKRAPLKWLMLCAASLYVLAGCEKTQPAQTPYTELKGTWKLKETGTDDNNNGILDRNELTPVPSGYVAYLIFTGTGTGTQKITVNDTTNEYSFTWTLTDQDSVLVRLEEGDSITSEIQELSSTDLLLQNNTSPVLSWEFYNKQ